MSDKVDSLIRSQWEAKAREVDEILYRYKARRAKVCPNCEIKMENVKFLWIFSRYKCPECGLAEAEPPCD